MKCPLRTSQSGYAMHECDAECAWRVRGKCAVVIMCESHDDDAWSNARTYVNGKEVRE